MKGYNIIGKRISARGQQIIQAFNPVTLKITEDQFHVATLEEADEALDLAQSAAGEFRKMGGFQRAVFLEAIAENIEALSTSLIQKVMEESGLPEGRVIGERGRTCGQLRFFARKLKEGSWVNAIIDTADPSRVPAKPDVRQYLEPIGPVVVFTASNFPLAFSTAGGDTASALAAGCPVIVKSHESHPGTNAMIAEAIQAAAIETGMPDGVFSSLNGSGFELGQYLVKHPVVRAVAFTGSFAGGKALYDLAQQREHPIPVFSEMGSVNPVFILPGAMASKTEEWAAAISQSINLGAGQFCTNPGLLVAVKNDHLLAFKDQLIDAMGRLQAATMLNKGIHEGYVRGKLAKIKEAGVKMLYFETDNEDALTASPCVLEVSAEDFFRRPRLREEVFGPFSILIVCEHKEEMQRVLQAIKGQLTVSFLGEASDLEEYAHVIHASGAIAGRIIINGLPTGVEVCEAMQHGGPFPATTDSRFTSVGGNAIYRFVRPVCFQDFPDSLLPDALKDGNPLQIWRLLNGEFTQAPLI